MDLVRPAPSGGQPGVMIRLFALILVLARDTRSLGVALGRRATLLLEPPRSGLGHQGEALYVEEQVDSLLADRDREPSSREQDLGEINVVTGRLLVSSSGARHSERLLLVRFPPFRCVSPTPPFSPKVGCLEPRG